MERTYFDDLLFEQEDFTKTPFSAGEYDQCTFSHCHFAAVALSGSVFVDCTFTGCDLSNVGLQKTAFRNCTFTDCKLLGTPFDHCDPFLFSIRATGCNLELASFSGRSLKKTVFRACSLRSADFTDADLSGSIFDACDLHGALFANTNLEGADLRTALHYSIDPGRNRVRKARFSLPAVTGLLDVYGVRID
ncbi:pentapeptide repeat-containing protein [Flaviaesturariibacter amylovorans]|uniref:Pentapeptide repeat-containing protein n=1 Tax=Flaviaesturariibacter amylovorans TaxID=1084520 RepID=A0ABP8HJM6_9BACT